jgi:ribonuclease P/MRP protein subunit RPP40
MLKKIKTLFRLFLQMFLNKGKCKIMHLGKNNPNRRYFMRNQDGTSTELEPTFSEKDLGISITPDLKWTVHIQNVASKANQILEMLKNTFSYFDEDMVWRLYTAFVRPSLEFGLAVWFPHLKKDIALLEKVQNRATRLSKNLSKKTTRQGSKN